MERHFRKYKVHSRFYKNINAEMVYMGFPEKCMEPLKREVELSGYSWIQVDENCVDIQGLPIAKSMTSFNISRLKNDLRFAYFQARKHKRNTHSICFINEKPVKREIIAANFRDRVGKGTDFGINRDILYQLIVEGLCKARWRSVPDRDLCQFLIRSFVFNDPLQGARFRSPRSAWKSDSIKFKSGCYAEISPFEILNVKSYFKKESQQSLDKKPENLIG